MPAISSSARLGIPGGSPTGDVARHPRHGCYSAGRSFWPDPASPSSSRESPASHGISILTASTPPLPGSRLKLAVAALFVRPPARASALSAMFILSMLADIATALIQIGGPLLASTAALNAFWLRAALTSAIFAIQILWWLGAMSSVLVSLQPELRLRVLARAAALWVALLAAHSIIPEAPAFVPPNFDVRTANWWEYMYAKYGVEHEVAQIEEKQADLLTRRSQTSQRRARERPTFT